jgi:hypothetical protein
MAEELQVSPEEITKKGGASFLLKGKTKYLWKAGQEGKAGAREVAQ